MYRCGPDLPQVLPCITTQVLLLASLYFTKLLPFGSWYTDADSYTMPDSTPFLPPQMSNPFLPDYSQPLPGGSIYYIYVIYWLPSSLTLFNHYLTMLIVITVHEFMVLDVQTLVSISSSSNSDFFLAQLPSSSWYTDAECMNLLLFYLLK